MWATKFSDVIAVSPCDMTDLIPGTCMGDGMPAGVQRDGTEESCWRIHEVRLSKGLKAFDASMSPRLIGELDGTKQDRNISETRIRLTRSEPWQ